jgi:hypothetical protein
VSRRVVDKLVTDPTVELEKDRLKKVFPTLEAQISSTPADTQFNVNINSLLNIDFSSPDFINSVPDIYSKEYRWIDTEEALRQAVEDFLSQDPRVIGVDLEYCTDFEDQVFVAAALL